METGPYIARGCEVLSKETGEPLGWPFSFPDSVEAQTAASVLNCVYLAGMTQGVKIAGDVAMNAIDRVYGRNHKGTDRLLAAIDAGTRAEANGDDGKPERFSESEGPLG